MFGRNGPVSVFSAQNRKNKFQFSNHFAQSKSLNNFNMGDLDAHNDIDDEVDDDLAVHQRIHIQG